MELLRSAEPDASPPRRYPAAHEICDFAIKALLDEPAVVPRWGKRMKATGSFRGIDNSAATAY
jgi:hypothetical protein